MKKKRNIFSIYVDIYGCTVSVIAGMRISEGERWWCERIQKLESYESFEKGPENDEMLAAHIWQEGSKDCCLVFKELKPCGSTLAHEAFHAACRILRISGVTFTRESEEAYAYLMGHIILKSAEKLYPERMRG